MSEGEDLEEVELDDVEWVERTALHDLPRDLGPSRAPSRIATEGPRRTGTSLEDAELLAAVVAPAWHALFVGPLLGQLPAGFRGRILEVGAGVGALTHALAARSADSKLIALEADHGQLEVLRRRMEGLQGRRVFTRSESPRMLSFGDEVFDLVVHAGSGFGWTDAKVLGEVRRVLAVEGRVVVALPLAGTFDEVHDVFVEVAQCHGDTELLARIESYRASWPTPSLLEARMAQAGFTAVTVTATEAGLTFPSARELFAHPVLRLLAVGTWRSLAGFDPVGAERWLDVERTFGVYLRDAPVSLRVVVGVLSATRR